ncbi:MAG: hypothetical protein LBP80_04305 [Treponema sp.]|jgi:hypothetical protein|nr:hypothetical protein [Treponema sp.]
MRDYIIAAALGNGKLRRFVPLVRKLKGGFIVFHFMVITLALNFPVMFAIARLEPWEFYSRLYGGGFAAALDKSGFSLPAAASLSAGEAAGGENVSGIPVDEETVLGFNGAMYAGGYGRQVMLPMLAFSLMLVLILQLVFYFLAAFFLGLARMTSSALPYRDRFGIFVLSSTLPAIGSAIVGLWLPTVHFVVFYFAEIILAFAVSRAYEEEESAA